MVYWDIKETLFLISVKIHCNQTVNSCNAKKISYKFCTYANTRFVFSVLTCPTEIRYYCYDITRRRTFCSINHKEEFH